ncbi:MAG: septum formation inhibitor Maf [Desulfobacteraceae bacterium]|nr:septum formation inhibitor Maf [Desulfobacteraceae bacterium]
MESINNKKLILASKSPRRKELLANLGINIEIFPSNLNEEIVVIKGPDEYAKELAFLKAKNIAKFYPNSWILGADTIVVVRGQILGKPKSKSHAAQMLNKLNNCKHSVFTGFCLMNVKENKFIKKAVETSVYFKYLTHQEINWYIDTGEPYDKAGAYGIQGIGAVLVKEISGSYSNVVGLPICEVFEELKNLNIIQI